LTSGALSGGRRVATFSIVMAASHVTGQLDIRRAVATPSRASSVVASNAIWLSVYAVHSSKDIEAIARIAWLPRCSAEEFARQAPPAKRATQHDGLQQG